MTTGFQVIEAGAEFESSNESIARIDGTSLVGVGDGEVSVCGKGEGYHACAAFVVQAAILNRFFSSENGASTAETMTAVDGMTAMSGGSAIFDVHATSSNYLTETSPDGKWVADLVNNKIMYVPNGKWFDLPAPIGGPSPFQRMQLVPAQDAVYVLFISDMNVSVAMVNADGTVSTAVPYAEADGENDVIATAALSHDSIWAAVVRGTQTAGKPTEEGHVRVQVVRGAEKTPEDLFTLPFTNFPYVIGPLFSPDDRWLAVGLTDAGPPVVPSPEAYQGTFLLYRIEGTGVERVACENLAPASLQFSPGSKFLYVEHPEGGLAYDLDGVTTVETPPGGRFTPWGTLHFAVAGQGYSAISSTDVLDAFELEPATGAMLPTRYFTGMANVAPSGRAAGLASLFAPVGAYTEDEWETWKWLSTTGTRSVEAPVLFEQADDPGAFLALALPVDAYPYAGGDGVQIGVEILPLGGGQSSIFTAGNQDVAGLDVSHNGLVFIVTSPWGHLVVSDTAMSRFAVIAVGMRAPVRASADGSMVAAAIPGGQTVVFETATGADVLRIGDAASVCVTQEDDVRKAYAVQRNSEIVRYDVDSGVAEEIVGHLDWVEADGDPEVAWADACLPMVATTGVQILLYDGATDGGRSLAPGGVTGINGTPAGMARDGSAVVFSGTATETIETTGGLLEEQVKLTELYAARAPDWEPERLIRHLAYEGGYNSGVNYSFGPPQVWPDADFVAVPFIRIWVEQGWSSEWGAYSRTVEDRQLLLVDGEGGSADNLGPMSFDPQYYGEGSGYLRLR